MDSFKSPLRYPGGKRSLYKYIATVLKNNNLVDGIYVEPYAGGSGAALELLLREFVQYIYLNDLDPRIYSFWQALLHETDDFIYLIKHVDVTLDEWNRQHLIFKEPNKYRTLELGFSTFFLNRCNRSGILGGRPIGGMNQTGRWKIDARYNKKNLIKRIETIALYRERIHIAGLDAKVFLETIINNNNSDDKIFIYLDPPYYIMGQQLYLNNYCHNDHLELATFVKKLPFSWMLSYDDVPEIKKMYRKKRRRNLQVYYQAHIRKSAKELLFFSDDLNLPPNKSM